jgi:hypothetical protein
MISLHTWVDRLISKHMWLMALQHRNSTLKAQLLSIWSSLSWFDLIWFELNRVTPPLLPRDMIGVCVPSQLCFKPRETTLSWSGFSWTKSPPCYRGTWSGVSSKPIVFQTEGDSTLSWSGLSWTESPPELPRDMIGCVFQAGCVSNRGRQHFELI